MKKVIFIIYTAMIAIMGICALAFREQLNICIDSVIPAAVLAVHLILGVLLLKDVLLWGTSRFHVMLNVNTNKDFKYVKDENGEGRLEYMDDRRAACRKKERTAVGYTFLISGALAIPFIFFFPIAAKWVSIALFMIPTFIGSGVAMFFTFKELRDDMKVMDKEYEKQKKELEEQKKLEEMGRWK